jgi:prepilin-type N-terminal cleavage/methylation domain-containing protein
MNPHKRSEAGYSLAEMLTVIAIIGVLALVSVPAFLTYFNSNKMKASLRNVTNDLRSARQLSISQGKQVLVTYPTGTNARSYAIYVGDKPFNSLTWKAHRRRPGGVPGTRTLDQIVYFPADDASTPQTFTDVLDCSAVTSCTAGTDSKVDIIFFPDGHAQLPVNATSATITLKTDRKIPKAQYAIAISPSGRVQAN